MKADCRQVKDCAKGWEMEPCKWIFNGSEEVSADMKIIVDLRTTVSDDLPNFERLLVASSCSSILATHKQSIQASVALAKAHEGWQWRCFGFGMLCWVIRDGLWNYGFIELFLAQLVRVSESLKFQISSVCVLVPFLC